MTLRYCLVTLLAGVLSLSPTSAGATGPARQAADLEASGRFVPWPAPGVGSPGFGVCREPRRSVDALMLDLVGDDLRGVPVSPAERTPGVPIPGDRVCVGERLVLLAEWKGQPGGLWASHTTFPGVGRLRQVEPLPGTDELVSSDGTVARAAVALEPVDHQAGGLSAVDSSLLLSGGGVRRVPEVFPLGEDVPVPGFEDREEPVVELWALDRAVPPVPPRPSVPATGGSR